MKCIHIPRCRFVCKICARDLPEPFEEKVSSNAPLLVVLFENGGSFFAYADSEEQAKRQAILGLCLNLQLCENHLAKIRGVHKKNEWL